LTARRNDLEGGRAAVVGIDWGTTHRRIVSLDENGQVIATSSDEQGMLRSAGRFRAAFDDAMAGIPLAGGARVVLSGMVGSAQGWHQVPYVDTSVPLASLREHLFVVPDAPQGLDVRIVPGYRWNGPDGRVDVMRGEETQLLGAAAMGASDGVFVLPGTHSKWVRVKEGRIEAFATFMTGELFALLSEHGTLASLMKEAVDDDEAFARGVRAAHGVALSNVLFQCRARVVAGEMRAQSARNFLSGVLIGSEWHDSMHRFGDGAGAVRIIGTPSLERLYARAAEHLGLTTEALSADALQEAAWRQICSDRLNGKT